MYRNVVFLTFWQSTLLAGLSMFGVVKDVKPFDLSFRMFSHLAPQTTFMSAEDINIGIVSPIHLFLHLHKLNLCEGGPFGDF